MKNKELLIDSMILIDEFGIPKAPGLRQLLDKDVRELYIRDKNENKERYIQECGVIYYLGDPKSPPKQQGLSYNESLKEAIRNFGLPSNYTPDLLVSRLIKRYYEENITESGVAVEALIKSIHNMNLSVNKLNEFLNNELNVTITIESCNNVISIMSNLKKIAEDLPGTIKKLREARDTLAQDLEIENSRGDVTVTSSMKAE